MPALAKCFLAVCREAKNILLEEPRYECCFYIIGISRPGMTELAIRETILKGMCINIYIESWILNKVI